MITEANLIPVIALLRQKRFNLTNEKVTQSEIADYLNEIGVEFLREYRLNGKDIPDFIIYDHVAIEIKIKGGSRDIYSQCERYCKHDKIKFIILMVNKAMGMPETINNKPVYVVNMGKAWL